MLGHGRPSPLRRCPGRAGHLSAGAGPPGPVSPRHGTAAARCPARSAQKPCPDFFISNSSWRTLLCPLTPRSCCSSRAACSVAGDAEQTPHLSTPSLPRPKLPKPPTQVGPVSALPGTRPSLHLLRAAAGRPPSSQLNFYVTGCRAGSGEEIDLVFRGLGSGRSSVPHEDSGKI